MLDAIHCNDGSISVPTEVAHATCQLAEEAAQRTVAILHCGVIQSGDQATLPAALLLEIAALSTLIDWKERGDFEHLGEAAPDIDVLKQDFLNRCGGGFKSFDDPKHTPISSLMIKLFTENFAMEAPARLNAKLVMTQLDEENFIEELAEFLWVNRHSLANNERGASTHGKEE